MGVITILYDFVNDADDPNIRAVACLALAKTGRSHEQPIKIRVHVNPRLYWVGGK